MSRTRAGFSVIEALVVVCVLSVALGALLFTQRVQTTTSTRLDLQAGALQSIHRLDAALRADLECAVPGTLQVEPALLRFTRVASTGAPEAPLARPPAETVELRFDRSGRRVVRNGKTMPWGPFDDVAFARAGDALSIRVSAEARTTCTLPIHLTGARARVLSAAWIGEP